MGRQIPCTYYFENSTILTLARLPLTNHIEQYMNIHSFILHLTDSFSQPCTFWMSFVNVLFIVQEDMFAALHYMHNYNQALEHADFVLCYFGHTEISHFLITFTYHLSMSSQCHHSKNFATSRSVNFQSLTFTTFCALFCGCRF